MKRRPRSPRYLLLAVCSFCAWAQAPKAFLEKLPPDPNTKVETISYVNAFDSAASSALIEVPKVMKGPLPLIVTPHGGNWTQEMNRSLWSGLADRFGVLILYPHHQGKLAPGVSLGSWKQLGNLKAAISEASRRYPVDNCRVYAAGISQGAIESLLLAGQNAGLLAGLLAINPIADFLAFYDATDEADDIAGKFRLKNWHVLRKVLEGDFGGTSDQVRAEYLVRSPILYSSTLASIPLILYWAEDDELIGRGATHQGGLLAETIRKFQPKAFTEKRHSGGHGYPFYRVNLSTFELSLFDREIFVESIKQLLSFRKC